VDLHPGVQPDLHADALLKVHARIQRDGPAHLLVLIPRDGQVLVSADLLELVAPDDEVALVADPLERVVLHALVVVLLRVDEDLLRALLVLETDLVEAAAPLLEQLFSVDRVWSPGSA